MPSSFRPGERTFPLHVHISALFITLLLLAGSALGIFNYRQTTAIIFSSSAMLFEQIQQDVQRDIVATYQPIRHLLGVLSYANGADRQDLDDRLPLLAPFAQALRDNPKLAALYLGYQDGDFFMLRSMRTRQLQQQFDAPPGAAFQLWSIDDSHNQYLFYDDQLQLLARRDLDSQSYDPRSRDWYSSALSDNAQITTAPYVFFSSGAIGTTLAKPVNSGTVLAADLTLEELSATLLKHKITPSSEVVLFDARNVAVAYPDSSRLIVDGAEPHLAHLHDLLPQLGDSFDDLPSGDSQPRVLEVAKERWVVSRSQVGEGGPNGLNLALLVPEQELLADAYRIRWQSALITLTALLLCLPLGWLVSRCITRPLARLQHQAEAMERFDFTAVTGVRSSVAEVDELAVAIARMKQTLIRYQNIIAELGHQPDSKALLDWVLRQTLIAVQAQAGIIYLLEAGRLRPHCLQLENDQCAVHLTDLLNHGIDHAASPTWLQQALQGEASVDSLGFDKAGDYQHLFGEIGSPRMNLLAIPLRDQQGELLGLMVLLQDENLPEASQEINSQQCVGFSRAVAKIAARHLENRMPPA